MENTQHRFWTSIMLLYAAFLVYLLFISNRTINLSWIDHGGWTYLQKAMILKINLKPFATINNYLYKYSIGYVGANEVLRNIGGNLVAFTPFALFFPALYRKMKHRINFYSFWIVMLVLIEATQYLTMSGAMDVDDFILNMLGLIIVYELFKKKSKTGGTQ